MNPPTGTAEAAAAMMQPHPLAAVVGRMVHYWGADTNPKRVRHDRQPFTATIVFVHPDGDVSVSGYTHYGEAFTEAHLTLYEAEGGERHGDDGGYAMRGAYCTWPVRK